MLIPKKIDYAKCRADEYDSIGDQLDRITKSLAYLQSQGVDIGLDGVEQVARCATVKNKFIKK